MNASADDLPLNIPRCGLMTPLRLDNKTPLTKDQLAAVWGDVDSAAGLFLRATNEYKTIAESNVSASEVSNVPHNS